MKKADTLDLSVVDDPVYIAGFFFYFVRYSVILLDQTYVYVRMSQFKINFSFNKITK